MRPASYLKAATRAVARLTLVMLVLAGLASTSACKKKQILGNPEETGKLARMAEGLEKAYADKPVPALAEPAGFAGRLAAWDDFRQCAVRTYLARRKLSEQAAKHGQRRTTHHASIGEEAIEECAVQAAVIDRDPSHCERLLADFPGPGGETTMPALRCWDARARVLGRPDECPVVWLPGDGFGRNPECLAMARRDESLCFFADNAPRCRALVQDSDVPCAEPDAARDCRGAVAFWTSLVPGSERKDRAAWLFDPGKLDVEDGPSGAGPGLRFQLDFLPDQDRKARLRFTVPAAHLGISWPTSGQSPLPPAPSGRWGAEFPLGAAHITSRTPSFSVKLAFHPAGSEATLPLQAPGPAAAATLIVVAEKPGQPGQLRRCWPASETRGGLSYRMTGQGPGALLEGRLEAEKVTCDDGVTAQVKGEFRIAVLDVR